jgi:hypothetical protein
MRAISEFMFRFPKVIAMRAPTANTRATLVLFMRRNRKLNIINNKNIVYRALFHQMFESGLAEKTPYINTLQGFSTSRPMVIKPANIAVTARKTVLLTRGSKVLMRKTCPSEEMIQRPVERQAK